MLHPRAVAARWRDFQSHPYFFQFALVYVIWRPLAFSVAMSLGIVDLRRVVYDRQYAIPSPIHILLPEASSPSGAFHMITACITTFFLIEASWRMVKLSDRARRLPRARAWPFKVVGVIWRYALSAALVSTVGQAVAVVRGFKILDLVWLTAVTIILAHRVLWPLQRAVMTVRDRRIRAARRVSLPS